MADNSIPAPTPSDIPPPSFTVMGDQSDILGGNDYKLGDTVNATLKVTSVSEGDSGRSVGFDVQSVEPCAPGENDGDENPDGMSGETPGDESAPPDATSEGGEGGDESEGDDAEESMIGYKRPKTSKKQVPKLSAKDLQDY